MHCVEQEMPLPPLFTQLWKQVNAEAHDDAFWQSAGFPSCENYNNQGRWDGGLSKLPGGPG